MKKTMSQSLIIGGLLTGCLGSCIASGAQILTPEGLRPIEDLKVGDLICSVHEETGELEISPILRVVSAFREVGQLELSDGVLALTSDHPVYDPVAREYAPAGDWLLGHRTALATYGEELKTQELVSSQVFVSMSQVFDLTVESALHNFIANGVIVHNKTPAPPPYMGEPPRICGLDGSDPGTICRYVDLEVATDEECDADGVECEVVDFFEDCGREYVALCKLETDLETDSETDSETE